MKAPLDYRRPGRDTIDVAMIRKRVTGPEGKRIGSLLLNFGGPGESGVVGLPRYAGDYDPLNERYDLVSFDPRGVGGTAPVRCGKKTFEGGDVCEKHSGRLLPYVGTSQTARDLDLMRYHLGDEKLNYFGVSYGTRLGGVYAHLFPKNVGRLVLEAPVDPTLNRLQQDLRQVRAVQLAFDRFAEHCASAYGDCPTGSDPEQAGQRVIELLDELENEPAPTNGDEKLDENLAAHAIANYLDLGKEGWGRWWMRSTRSWIGAPAASCWRGRTTTALGSAPEPTPGAASTPAASPRAMARPPLSRSPAPTPICASASPGSKK